MRKKPKRHFYTGREIAFLRKAYAKHDYHEVAVLFARRFGVKLTKGQVRGAIHNHKLYQYERTGRFIKGQVSHNTGRKGECVPGSEKGWFKKGHLPYNYMPVGSEKIVVEHKSRKRYYWVKVADPNKWRQKSHLVWEAANKRRVPKNHVLVFGDGDTLNCTPDNLILVSRAQLLVMNGRKYFYDNADMTRVGATMAALVIEKGKRRKPKPKKEESVT